jgi:DNA-binding CsgD family transcriptional regulator
MLLRIVCTDGTIFTGTGILTAGETHRVGRSRTCTFVVKDLSVSRFHAEVIVDDDGVFVKDLGSRNGTFVDGTRITEATAWQAGQSVRFGNAVFHLVVHDEKAAVHEDSEVSTFVIHMPASAQPEAVSQLSEAQKRVLALLLEGKSEKECATHLKISQHTVHNHVKEIYKKMGVNSRPELLAIFVRESKKLSKPRK